MSFIEHSLKIFVAAPSSAFLRKLPVQGVLQGQALQLRQKFQRLPAASTKEAADARFEYFTRSVWLSMKDSGALGGSGCNNVLTFWGLKLGRIT